MTPQFRECVSCGSSHMGPVPCGMTFAQRMKTTVTDYAAFDTVDTSSLHKYYDGAAVDTTFGHDSTDRLYDETDGIGPVKQDNNGEWWHKSRNKEPEKMTEKDMESMVS